MRLPISKNRLCSRLWVLALVLAIGMLALACEGSGGSADSDGDGLADGDQPVMDGDDDQETSVDGDDPAKCDTCQTWIGSYCLADAGETDCGLSLPSSIVLASTGGYCEFALTFLFDGDSPPLSLVFEGCIPETFDIPGEDCSVAIDGAAGTVSLECDDGCQLSFNRAACLADGDADGDIEPDCVCGEANICCDGCRAINEGGACDDLDGCTLTDTCRQGACFGADVQICQALDQCHTAGSCDPASGRCSDPIKDDATPCDDADLCTLGDACLSGACLGDAKVCEALDDCHQAGQCGPADGSCSHPFQPEGQACDGAGDGSTGSGVCDEGACEALDDCLLRSFQLPINHACNFDAECGSGLCAWATFCSQPCNPKADDCPADMFCSKKKPDGAYSEYYHICLPLAESLPGDGSLGLFDPCNRDEDCEDGPCVTTYGPYPQRADTGLKYCTRECTPAEPGEDDPCGPCGTCGAPRNGGERVSIDCTANFMQETGSTCDTGYDCLGGLCIDNFCSQACVERNGCPDNFTCTYATDLTHDYGLACIADSRLKNKGAGESCRHGYECETGLACDLRVPAISWTGLYRYYDQMEMDPEYTHKRGTYLLKGYRIPETKQYTMAAWGDSVGHYTLNAWVDSEAMDSISEIEPNGDPLIAGLHSIPLRVSASHHSNWDPDYWTVDLEAGQFLKIEVSAPQHESTCQNLLGLGDACLFNEECESNICQGSCAVTCTMNREAPEDSCPGGFECVNVAYYYEEPKLLCLPAGTTGLPFGGACTGNSNLEHYQCESETCHLGKCNKECNWWKRGVHDDCPSGYTCLNLYSYDRPPRKYRCVETELIDLPWGEACIHSYQCSSGTCYRGFCNKWCEIDPVDGDLDEDQDRDVYEYACPEGTSCVALDGYRTRCLPTEELDREFGDTCFADYNCLSGRCWEGLCNMNCIPVEERGEDGSDCPAGYNCVEPPPDKSDRSIFICEAAE